MICSTPVGVADDQQVAEAEEEPGLEDADDRLQPVVELVRDRRSSGNGSR